jgi:hypothetical protein
MRTTLRLLRPPSSGMSLELTERFEDFVMLEVRIVQRRDLHPALVDQLGVSGIEPSVLDRLTMRVGPGIGAASDTRIVCGLISAAKRIVSSIVSLVSPADRG